MALRARKEMPWGESVPEREFRHFVLPVRVNNENLDMSRRDFYESLRDRVKDMSMRDAVLEVNHWCHERVTYRPSDARTSSPSATVRSAIGRCGEESTFTVAALRAVGIPARQVYTPHTSPVGRIPTIIMPGWRLGLMANGISSVRASLRLCSTWDGSMPPLHVAC